MNAVSSLSRYTSDDLFDPEPPRRKAGTDMQEIREPQEIRRTQETQDRSGPTVTGGTGWQSPEYEVVDTALEVTAYALVTR
jgi:coenzyme PQQ precursor peptide PqqA